MVSVRAWSGRERLAGSDQISQPNQIVSTPLNATRHRPITHPHTPSPRCSVSSNSPPTPSPLALRPKTTRPSLTLSCSTAWLTSFCAESGPRRCRREGHLHWKGRSGQRWTWEMAGRRCRLGQAFSRTWYQWRGWKPASCLVRWIGRVGGVRCRVGKRVCSEVSQVKDQVDTG